MGGESVIVEWPSAELPGISPFRLALPDGWTAVEPLDALVAMAGPEVDGFRPNLIVFGARLPETADLAEVADGALAHCEPASLVGPVLEQPDGEQLLAVAVRRGTCHAEDLELVQLVAVVAAEDLSTTGLRSVFALLGTCPADRVDPDEAVLTDVISSFRICPVRPPALARQGA